MGILIKEYISGGHIVEKMELQQAIETCRQEMIDLSAKYGLSALVVIQTSKHLDYLLNCYENNQSAS